MTIINHTGTDEDTETHSEWEGFGRPLFQDAAALALGRVGVIDVGSNSVRLVVFDGAARSPAYFYNEKIMCALGAGLANTKRLNPEGRVRALRALERFAALAERMGITPLTAVATAAVREAEDGADFCQDVLNKTGIKVWVIDGPEEARLSAQGVLLGWPKSYGLVCDMGGASMELSLVSQGQISSCVTSPLGPLKLQSLSQEPIEGAQGGSSELEQFISQHMTSLHHSVGASEGLRLFLVGGSWRAIARIDMERRGYPLTVLHEYRMSHEHLEHTIEYIKTHGLKAISKQCSLSKSRSALIPQALLVLQQLVTQFKPKDLMISSYGIREGMLYQQMPQELKERDPLIEACRFSEQKDARQPGFGLALYRFIRPLFPEATWQTKRLMKAACLLHDVSWRAHPDYRAQATFDNATRANLGGLKHKERITLGLALMYRYGASAQDVAPFQNMLDLLPEKRVYFAKLLGQAMRLGATLWVENGKIPAQLTHDQNRLTITLDQHAAALFSEVSQKHLNKLAKDLCKTHATIAYSS